MTDANLERTRIEHHLLSALTELANFGRTDVPLVERVCELADRMDCDDGCWRYSSASVLHVVSIYAPLRYRYWCENVGLRDLRTEESLLLTARTVDERFWGHAWELSDGTAQLGASSVSFLRELLVESRELNLLLSEAGRSFWQRNVDWANRSGEVVPRAFVSLRDYLWYHSVVQDEHLGGDPSVSTWMTRVSITDVELATAVTRRLDRRYAAFERELASEPVLPWRSRTIPGHSVVESFLVGGIGRASVTAA